MRRSTCWNVESMGCLAECGAVEFRRLKGGRGVKKTERSFCLTHGTLTPGGTTARREPARVVIMG
jgi:hypothetical protein